MSGRSCSLARTLFFIAELFVVHELPYRAVIDLEATGGSQLGYQPTKRELGRLAALDQPVTVRPRDRAWLVATHLARLYAASLPEAFHPADRGADRYSKTRGCLIT